MGCCYKSQESQDQDSDTCCCLACVTCLQRAAWTPGWQGALSSCACFSDCHCCLCAPAVCRNSKRSVSGCRQLSRAVQRESGGVPVAGHCCAPGHGSPGAYGGALHLHSLQGEIFCWLLDFSVAGPCGGLPHPRAHIVYAPTHNLQAPHRSFVQLSTHVKVRHTAVPPWQPSMPEPVANWVLGSWLRQTAWLLWGKAAAALSSMPAALDITMSPVPNTSTCRQRVACSGCL